MVYIEEKQINSKFLVFNCLGKEIVKDLIIKKQQYFQK